MPTAYETEVLNATREELASVPFLKSDGITVESVELDGEYPGARVIVTYTQDGVSVSKSFLIYDRSYPGGDEQPPVGTIAAVIATNILD